MTDREGPSITIRASCFDCKHCHSESYRVQGDSGSDVFCTFNGAKKTVGDTRWDTPVWCPFLDHEMKNKLASLAA